MVPRVVKIECPLCSSQEVTLVHADFQLYRCSNCHEHFDEDEPGFTHFPKPKRRHADDWDDS
jgi:transposase-like protein